MKKKVYSVLAASAAAVVANQADAAITYFDYTDAPVVSENNREYDLSWEGAESLDIYLNVTLTGAYSTDVLDTNLAVFKSYSNYEHDKQFFSDMRAQTAAMNVGDVITADSFAAITLEQPWPVVFSEATADTDNPTATASGSGYFGIKITEGEQDYIGWANVDYSISNTYSDVERSSYMSISLKEYALEDASASIAVGQVPEPATMSLLALGAVGVSALRRRRK